MWPLFSIIVVSKNEGGGLKLTVESILQQNYSSFEIIIIDACSNDGSTSFLNELSLSNLTFISERDKGIYDGMNKGIKNSTGTYIFFLNAGDKFFDANILEQVSPLTKFDPDLIIGNVLLQGEINSSKEFHPFYKNLIFYPGFNHQRVFHHRRLFEEFGLYNLEFKIAADRDFLFRIFKKSKDKIQYLDLTLTEFFLGGLSTHPDSQKLSVNEQLLLFKKYFSALERLCFIVFFNFDPAWPNPKNLIMKLLNVPIIKNLRFSMQQPIAKLLGWA